MFFSDLREAGRALAAEVARQLDSYGHEQDVVVVGIARGGVPVAAEVANGLDAPLDVVLIRRLLAPGGIDSLVCAANVCGNLVLDEELPPRSAVAESPWDHFVADALAELSRRERACRNRAPALDLAQKTILLVDNGIRTGSTVRAALRAMRTLAPARVIVAAPVAAPECRALVESLAGELICLAWPQPFGHVGMFYKDFSRPDDNQIREMLKTRDR